MHHQSWSVQSKAVLLRTLFYMSSVADNFPEEGTRALSQQLFKRAIIAHFV